MKLFLIGLPGSGKSTLGKQLAEQLELPFIDLDDAIEAEAKQPIREIFAQQGEDYFRSLEQKTLVDTISQKSDFVMATGGGAPCFFDNMYHMNQAGTTIFMDIPVEVITERMEKEGVAVRPLLHELDTDNFANAYYHKFAHRLPYYRQAKLIVTAEDDLDSILDQLKS
ncbi:shikimate kinase [Tunicatimonas pelagia]|uniref:shikimate kinase n=1 Tax=Tunicatimonas pelagia TaxID=931531 RepID=UPI0026650976|nr:shikimate kinase [Tunicatimonas pelagia]WKN41727.1 shikimate kinase [Tunicatimonas pelagia]